MVDIVVRARMAERIGGGGGGGGGGRCKAATAGYKLRLGHALCTCNVER